MQKLFDLSHPILEKSPCSFRVDSNSPKFLFVQDDANGCFYINMQVDNLTMNYGTHITFSGALLRNQIVMDKAYYKKTITDYNIEDFVGKVLIIDMSQKIKKMFNYFDKSGHFNIELTDINACYNFLKSIDELKITFKDFKCSVSANNLSLSEEIKGILFYTGLSKFWKYEKFESWEYIYFLGLDLTDDLSDFFIKQKLKFVGIDSFQLGNPIINFSSQEKAFVLSSKCQEFIKSKNNSLKHLGTREKLLANQVYIYENLNIPKELINSKMEFFGVPMNIGITDFNCCSIVRPFVRTLDFIS